LIQCLPSLLILFENKIFQNSFYHIPTLSYSSQAINVYFGFVLPYLFFGHLSTTTFYFLYLAFSTNYLDVLGRICFLKFTFLFWFFKSSRNNISPLMTFSVTFRILRDVV
jgi:hypothetical protein